MRKFFMALCLAFPLMLVAQQKIAVVNTQEIMTELPDVKAAETKLKELASQFDADIKTMQEELQNKAEKFQKERETLPEALQKSRTQELEDISTRIQQSYQAMQEELSKRQKEALAPIQEKVKQAIHKVAEANAVTYVLEDGAMLFIARDAIDLTAKVKEALGIKATVAKK